MAHTNSRALGRKRVRAMLCCSIGSIGLWAVLHGSAAAQDTAERGQRERGPVLVLSPARVETPISEVASGITRITRSELDLRQVRYVSDVLRTVPGVAVSRSGGFGGFTQVRIRGTEANHTLVLIDGIEANDPFASEFDFGNLLVDDIERIEILRGPHSALYGSDAIGGVIHIITRQGEEGLAGRLRLETGSPHSHAAALGLRGGTGPLRYTLNFRGQTTRGVSQADRDDGNHEEDPFREQTLSARLDWDASDQLELGSSLRLTRSRAEFDGFAPPTFAFGDTNEYSNNDEFYGSVHARLLSTDGRIDTRATIAFTDVEADSYANSVKTSFTDGERTKMGIQSAIQLDERLKLLVGAERESERAQNQRGGIDNVDRRIWVAGYFAQIQAEPLDDLHTTLGVRLTDHQVFGSQTTANIGLTYRVPSTATKLKFEIGTGFKAPTLNELFVSTPFFVGNRDLDPERSRGLSVGFEQSFMDDRLTLDVQYFENRVRGLIVGVPTAAGTFTNRNVNRSNARGIEVSARWFALPDLEVSAAYTFTKTRDGDTHDKLVRRAGHLASLSADYRAGPLGVHAGLIYNGRQDDLDFSSFPSRQVRLRDYWLAQLALTYRLNQRVSLFARVENINDKDYTEIIGFGSVGRTAHVGIELEFD